MAKALIMMSGGVDSSVAAALLIEQGYEVTGVTLRLADSPPDSGRVGGCCSLSDVEDARCVAHFLGIPHYSLNEKEVFARTVLDNFKKEYQSGRTPNPCYRCNQWIKFDYVYNWARELDF
ncbi:MAG: tRNA 2-thiouridine(34) synthase MnmA, partial [Candidatus Omnitrophica bacterium]|nr:tRNA 2-thiouridine(34) synthase MnmA [Candidatus Omnitrophota bacterium]